MMRINNLEEWISEYFKDPANITKSEKACERYDRLLVQNIKKMMLSGEETIEIEEAAKNDPGKRLEKVKYENIPSVEMDGKKGKLRVNLLDRTAEFIEG